jgi:heme-degrading monooxygenase HmoA
MDGQRKEEWPRILAEELVPLCATADGFRFLYFADWAEHPADGYRAVTGWDTTEQSEAFFSKRHYKAWNHRRVPAFKVTYQVSSGTLVASTTGRNT